MGGIPCDWEGGLSGINQLDSELFGQHCASLITAALWVVLEKTAVWVALATSTAL